MRGLEDCIWSEHNCLGSDCWMSVMVKKRKESIWWRTSSVFIFRFPLMNSGFHHRTRTRNANTTLILLQRVGTFVNGSSGCIVTAPRRLFRGAHMCR